MSHFYCIRLADNNLIKFSLIENIQQFKAVIMTEIFSLQLNCKINCCSLSSSIFVVIILLVNLDLHMMI